MNNDNKALHEQFNDSLAPLVDGDERVAADFADLVAEDDALRDTLFDAKAAAEAVSAAGDDFVLPADLSQRIDKALAADEKPAASATKAPSKSGGIPGWMSFAAAAAMIAGGGLWLANRDTSSGTKETVSGGTGASIALVAGVNDNATVMVDGKALGTGSSVSKGQSITTDGKTRAEVVLGDGSKMIVGQESEVRLQSQTARGFELVRGMVVTDVHKADSPFAITLEHGHIEVLGTRFVTTKTEDGTSVRVTRGLVRLIHEKSGDSVLVNPGQEGLLSSAGVNVGSAVNLAQSLSWSELHETHEKGAVGLGQLKAQKPGDPPDRSRPLTLSNHQVKVRVVGNIARTDVEQTFRNDTKNTLEGIYSFPLPPDASIDRLALDVNGGFEEGAFVDRQRASKIWAGVIHHATPKTQRQQNVEMVWVPGPWRDPALLEWQRGGNFELRIFPIPAKGQRTIKLSYTQVISPYGNKRRYVYPMAHSSDGSTAAENFDLEVRVAGADNKSVRHFGYPLESVESGAAIELAHHAKSFIPSGDLVVDYALANEDSELRYWTFAGEAAAAPGEISNAKITSTARAIKKAAKDGAAPDPRVVEEQRALAADARPYAVFALRPALPDWTEHKAKDIVLVVDSSQSMVGERFARSIQLVSSMVTELDRRDRFTVMACDFDCQTMSDGLQDPGAAGAKQAEAFLGGIRPAGSSNLIAALTQAGKAFASGDREKLIIYIGDGMSSVGPRNISSVVDALSALDSRATVSTVGIGGDSDTQVLGAVARVGGGHFVPYVPGESVSTAALKVLETTYGPGLKNATVTLPAGFDDIGPASLPTIRSGQEIVLAARFNGPTKGKLAVKGTVAGEPFERSYDVDVKPSTSMGNAFVPQVWAATRVRDLELSGDGAKRPAIVALSKSYSVMSRHTSLLVLESEAMFSAFGVDRSRSQVTWTGDDEDVEVAAADSDGLGTSVASGSFGAMGGGKGAGPMPSKKAKPMNKPSASARADFADDFGGMVPDFDAPAAEPARDRAADREMLEKEERQVRANQPLGRRRSGSWMKRVWFKTAAITPSTDIRNHELNAAITAEQRLAENPDSRDRQRELVRALSRAGDLDRAERAAESWLTRDQLDTEALTYLSDIVGRQGRRHESLRLLSGIVDLDRDSVRLHERMVNALRRAGMYVEACNHQHALAEIQLDQASVAGEAVRCKRTLGDQRGATGLLSSVTDGSMRIRVEEAAAKPAQPEKLSGKVMVKANWETADDLDLSIITPQGTRISWMGGRTNSFGDNATMAGQELLGLRNAGAGDYIVEISRAESGPGAARAPVRGTIRMQAFGTTRMLPFSLSGERAQVGRIRVSRESRLIPAN